MTQQKALCLLALPIELRMKILGLCALKRLQLEKALQSYESITGPELTKLIEEL